MIVDAVAEPIDPDIGRTPRNQAVVGYELMPSRE